MLQIPEGIPKDLVDELEACQKQLKILFGNYKVFSIIVIVFLCHLSIANTSLFSTSSF